MQRPDEPLLRPAQTHRDELPHRERQDTEPDQQPRGHPKSVPVLRRLPDPYAKCGEEQVNRNEERRKERPRRGSDCAELADGLITEAVTFPVQTRQNVGYRIKDWRDNATEEQRPAHPDPPSLRQPSGRPAGDCG